MPLTTVSLFQPTVFCAAAPATLDVRWAPQGFTAKIGLE
jgi:hypothetical protein